MTYYKEQLSHCVACNSETIYFFDERQSRGINIEKVNFNLFKCKTCGCIFINPRPSSEFLERIYSKSGHGLKALISVEDVLMQEKEYPNAFIDSKRLINKALNKLSENKLNRKMLALDIGSGFGFYSKAAINAGFNVTAVNPSVWENDVFERMNGFRPIQKFFEEIDFNNTKFDLVILSQVLEHIDNPFSFLNKVKEILTPKGIVAIAVPNLNSFWVKMGKDGGVFWIPEHLNCFTKTSLFKLVKRLDYKIVSYQAISRCPYNYISNRLNIKGRKRILLNHFVKIIQFLPFRIFNKIGLGGVLNIWIQV
jgi:SAM-dependent methyltransferase